MKACSTHLNKSQASQTVYLSQYQWPSWTPEPAAQNPEQNRTVQEGGRSWAPLLQDISVLSNIEEQKKQRTETQTKNPKTRLRPETDSDLQPQMKTPVKKNIRPTKQKAQ